MAPSTKSYYLIEMNNVEPLGSRKIVVDPWEHLLVPLSSG
jgi:hypothetical protein